jgi:hypothetical protein
MICISYILLQVLKSHGEKPNQSTLITPFGYILLGGGQYLLIFWSIDGSIIAFWTGIALRLAAHAAFLFVSYKTVYSSEEGKNEDNSSPG